jgi:hypothetical protein
MDIGSILLILALLTLVGLFITRPFLKPEKKIPALATEQTEDQEYSHLLAERDRILNTLQELDFDYTLGKIPEEDYPVQRGLLLQKGADILRQIDERTEHVTESPEVRLEAALLKRRQAVGGLAGNGHGAALRVVDADDDLEALLASRRRERNEKSGGFCPKCGGTVQKSDKFCPRCGAAL